MAQCRGLLWRAALLYAGALPPGPSDVLPPGWSREQSCRAQRSVLEFRHVCTWQMLCKESGGSAGVRPVSRP